MACVLPNSTTVILSWKLINTTVRTLLPSLWSKQWNRKTRCHFLTDLNRQGWTPHITSAGRLHYTALGSARATEILIFTEPARTHTEKSIFQCTQQNRRQSWDQLLGPASTAVRPWLRRGWGAGGDNARGRGPPQTREGSDKQPSVQREDRGEWRERSLRIKQLEGALIYPSTGGKWGEGQSKLRREDGRNFTGKNLPMNFFFFWLFCIIRSDL